MALTRPSVGHLEQRVVDRLGEARAVSSFCSTQAKYFGSPKVGGIGQREDVAALLDEVGEVRRGAGDGVETADGEVGVGLVGGAVLLDRHAAELLAVGLELAELRGALLDADGLAGDVLGLLDRVVRGRVDEATVASAMGRVKV